MNQKSKELIYTGDASKSEWLSNVPARDLTLSEASACGYSAQELVETGLYRIYEEPKQAKNVPELVQTQPAKSIATSNKK